MERIRAAADSGTCGAVVPAHRAADFLRLRDAVGVALPLTAAIRPDPAIARSQRRSGVSALHVEMRHGRAELLTFHDALERG